MRLNTETLSVLSEADVYVAIRLGRTMADEMGFDYADQTRLETVIAELARNALQHGGGGVLTLQRRERDGQGGDGTQLGLEIAVEDHGPGIADLAQVLANGHGLKAPGSNSGGLGVGIAAVRRLVDEFAIESAPGRGTRVRACKWKRQIVK